jgi:hypothetical protein
LAAIADEHLLVEFGRGLRSGQMEDACACGIGTIGSGDGVAHEFEDGFVSEWHLWCGFYVRSR